MSDNPVARWNAHNPQQTYHYIGKDGQSVLARVLEDQRDAALARIAELEAERDAANAAGYRAGVEDAAKAIGAEVARGRSFTFSDNARHFIRIVRTLLNSEAKP
jgi:exosome complex RNA-binding protein Csl4